MYEIAPSKHVKKSTAIVVCLVFTMICAGCGKESEKNEYPLGRAHFAISGSAEAQQEFNRAVVLLHHMTYPQARAAFKHVAELDSNCAMAHWGIAMTLFQPLWPTRPGPKELQQGWEAVQRAKALAAPTERERLFIAATEAFFLEPAAKNYWERIRRWEKAMETLYNKFPEDHEVAAFYALAHLATAPSGGSSLDHQNLSAKIALSIHAENPIHPGSIHYLIHANDVRGRQHESLDIVRSYNNIAPRNPHALHMPTHIFTRLGNWDEVIAGNINAAAAALEHPAGDKGQYVWDEYPHALEYLLYAYLQKGADEMAAEKLALLHAIENLHPTFKTAFNLSSMSVRYALERKSWEEAAALIPRANKALAWDRFLWPEAISWFARGLGAAHLGQYEDAKRAHARLQALENTADKMGEKLFTRQIRVLRLAVDAWIAQFQGKSEHALMQMKAAAELEFSTRKHPVTPGPNLPSIELLGEMLMEQGKPDNALAAFKRSLQLYPKRFNSILGAARAARALEDTKMAKSYYAELLKICVPESKRAGLQEARTYAGRLESRE